MLSLYVEDSQVDLTPGVAITFKGTNPAFDLQHIDRVFSFPFFIPATPNNLRRFAHQNRLDVFQRPRTYPATIFYDGVPVESGALLLQNHTDRGWEAVFSNAGKNLWESLAEVKINTLAEVIEIPQVVPITGVFVFDPFPFQHTILIGAFLFDIDGTAGYTKETLAQQFTADINAVYPGLASWNPGQDFLFITAATYPIVLQSGFTALGPVNEAEQKMYNFHTWFESIYNTPDPRLTMPVTYNPSFYEDRNEYFLNYINYHRGGDFIHNLPNIQNTRWEHTFVPYIRLPYLLQQIAAWCDLSGFEGDAWDDPDFQALTIYNNRAIDELGEIVVGGITFYLNHYKQTIELNAHLPDLSAQETIEAILLFFSFFLRVEKDKFVLRSIRNFLLLPPLDLSGRIAPGYDLTADPAQGFTLGYTYDDDDDFRHINSFEDFVSAPGLYEHRPEIAPVGAQTHLNTYHGEALWHTLYLRQAGTTDSPDPVSNDYAFRVFFDRGIAQDSADEDYLKGTNNRGDSGNWTLDYAGEAGLYATWYQGYIEAKVDGPKLTIIANLDLPTLLLLKTWETARISFDTPQGMVQAIVYSFSTRLTHDSVGPTTLELILEP